MTHPAPLFLRALLAFVLLPGVVAGLVPWLLFEPRSGSFHKLGLAVIALGSGILLWCVRDFYVAGKGTLAPWDPPQRLVVVGLYRYTRNPMYLAILVILSGWVLASGSWLLALYAVGVGIVFHVRVLLWEEPRLARSHGDEWRGYAARVPRWLFPVKVR